MEASLAPIETNSKNENWVTYEIKKDIAVLFNQGRSYLAIGDKYGVSRSAISGLIRRIRTQHPEIYVKPKEEQIRKKPAKTQVKIIKLTVLKSEPQPGKPKRERLKLKFPTNVSIYELNDNICHWPSGASPDITYCGKQVRDDKCPYCEVHALMAYIEPRKRYR